jgi:hypothetical protein
MIKSEIFASVLRDVCEVTGISEHDIMSKSKSEEIVDARHLLVVTLRRSGYYPGMIAERLHISGRAVRKELQRICRGMACAGYSVRNNGNTPGCILFGGFRRTACYHS